MARLSLGKVQGFPLKGLRQLSWVSGETGWAGKGAQSRCSKGPVLGSVILAQAKGMLVIAKEGSLKA